MKHKKPAIVGAIMVLMLVPFFVSAQDETPTDDASEIPYSRKGADTCLSCHDDDQVVLSIFRTKHGVPDNPHSPFGAGQLQCEACHGPGSEHSGRVRRGQERAAIMSFIEGDATPADTQDEACLSCHAADEGAAWHGGVHATNDVTCASCHSVHARKDPILNIATQNEQCLSCHTNTRAETRKPFAHPLHKGKMACTDCHTPHGTSVEHELVQNSVNETCYDCHAEKRGPFLWEHAPATEDCLSCHSPHGSSQPGMLTRRAPLLCQSCHSQAGHPSIALTSEGLAGATVSPFLLGNSCMNCHSQVHGSNHPSGSELSR